MSATTAIIDDVANAFFAALEEGPIERVLACYAPDARIWHNFDQITMTPEESAEGLKLLFGNFASRKYVEVRRQSTPDGFVQQHVLRLERPDGQIVDWPGCLVVDVTDGMIVRVDEYLDIGQLNGGQ